MSFIGTTEATIVEHNLETSQKGTPCLRLDVDFEGQREPIFIYFSTRTPGAINMWKNALQRIGFDGLSIAELDDNPQLLAGNKIPIRAFEDPNWGYKVELASRGKIKEEELDRINAILTSEASEKPEDIDW